MNKLLLINLTTNCKSGTLTNGINNPKIKTILSNIQNKNYGIFVENGYILVKHSAFNPNKHFRTISSHVDCVYESPFCRFETDQMIGTFDNSITNYAMLELINSNTNPQNMFIFTDNEETNSTTLMLLPFIRYRKFMYNICLDVTPFCHYTHFATIENDQYKKSKIKIKEVAKLKPYQGMNDESVTLNNNKIKSFSYCITCDFDCNRCHSEKGGKIDYKNLDKYINGLRALLR